MRPIYDAGYNECFLATIACLKDMTCTSVREIALSLTGRTVWDGANHSDYEKVRRYFGLPALYNDNVPTVSASDLNLSGKGTIYMQFFTQDGKKDSAHIVAYENWEIFDQSHVFTSYGDFRDFWRSKGSIIAYMKVVDITGVTPDQEREYEREEQEMTMKEYHAERNRAIAYALKALHDEDYIVFMISDFKEKVQIYIDRLGRDICTPVRFIKASSPHDRRPETEGGYSFLAHDRCWVALNTLVKQGYLTKRVVNGRCFYRLTDKNVF